MAKALVLGIVLSLAAAAAGAQTAATPIKDPKGFASDFLAQLQKSGPAAYDSLKSSGLALQGVDNLKQTATRLQDSVGPMSGSEFIDETKLGKSVVRLTYLELHDRGPVAQTMVFYMAPKQSAWRLIGMEMTAEPARFPFHAP